MVVDEVLRELRKPCFNEDEIRVGLDDYAEEVMQLLEVNLKDVRIVGMWGLGGIGKTTLAKYVYYRAAYEFECCSFVADIRETCKNHGGLLSLQRKLVSDILGKRSIDFSSTDEGTNLLRTRVRAKKSLILLDDVDRIDQLKALAGDIHWFGPGSRILVTTRNKDVLLQLRERRIHEVKPLDDDRAFLLFCKHAFRKELPPPEFADLSREIVSTAGGLPLALEVIGSYLHVHRENKGVWHEAIDELRQKPHADVQGKLRISYDALEDGHKEMFLDIACFFIGVDYQKVIPMWDACKFFPRLGVEVLLLRSLIKIGKENELQMHDQVRDLGRHIVEQKCNNQPAQKCRLWTREDATNVLLKRLGTSKVEAVQIWTKGKVRFSGKCFENMKELRILQLRGDVALGGNFQNLLPRLRWLSIGKIRNKSLLTSLHLNNLIVLDLSESGIDEHWKGWRSTKMGMLKVLDLSRCEKLRRTPCFSAFPNMERLIFEKCFRLVSIDPSIELLKNLNHLNLMGCSKLSKFPCKLGHLEALAVLLVDLSAVEEIPVSTRMKKLEILSANGCKHLKRLPEDISSLPHLHTLHLDRCRSLETLPDLPPSLKSLRIDTGNGKFAGYPYLGGLVNLKNLHWSVNGMKLEERSLAELCKLEKLLLDGAGINTLPEVMSSFSQLREIKILNCKELASLPMLPSGLCSLQIEACPSLQLLPNLSNLRKLSQLHISQCRGIREIHGLGELISLQILFIDGSHLTVLDGIESAVSLREFFIRDCSIKRLQDFPDQLRKLEFQNCSSLEGLATLSKLELLVELNIQGCTTIQRLPDLSNLRRLKHLIVSGCWKLRQIEGLGELQSLRELDISGCSSIEKLPDLSKLQSLVFLYASVCVNLRQIEEFGELGSLEYLNISGCIEMEKLPDLSKLQRLWELNACGCVKLYQLDGLGELVSLVSLDISGCIAIEKLPDLSKLRSLETLYMSNCKNIRDLLGVEKLRNLDKLDTSGCESLHFDIFTRARFRRTKMVKEVQKVYCGACR